MLQTIFNGVVAGALVALPALGLTLVFAVVRFPNVAAGAMITVGAYLTYFFSAGLQLPLPLASLFAILAASVLLVATDRLVFQPIRQSDYITLMVASIGVLFVFQNAPGLFYGTGQLSLDTPLRRPMTALGVRINIEQIYILIVSVSAMILIFLLLSKTKLGRAMRAVADNADLASLRGIETNRVIMTTWALAGALSALAGILIARDTSVNPLMGHNYLISAFAAAIVGGFGNPLGAVVGGVAVGIIEELSTKVLPTTYRQAVSFAVIVLFLLIRPHGLFGSARIAK